MRKITDKKDFDIPKDLKLRKDYKQKNVNQNCGSTKVNKTLPKREVGIDTMQKVEIKGR